MLVSNWRLIQNRRRIAALLGSGAAVGWIPPTTGNIDEGDEDDGSFSDVQSCTNSAYWVIQETASGIDVSFTFRVTGKAKKVRVKGRWAGSNAETLSIQAWDGLVWTEIALMTEEVSDQEYTVNLGDEYTIDGITKIRVYRAAGVNNKLWLDCISVFADEYAPDISEWQQEDGYYLLTEDGDYIDIGY